MTVEESDDEFIKRMRREKGIPAPRDVGRLQRIKTDEALDRIVQRSRMGVKKKKKS